MPLIHQFRTTLRTKIILLACIIALVASLAVALFNGYRIQDVAVRRANDALISETQTLSIRLEGDFSRTLAEAKLVSLTPPIKGIIRSQENNGVDPVDGSTTELWRGRLASIFSSVMEGQPAYTQMRYIGFSDQGREIVRVNRTEDGFEIVSAENLQAKGGEAYMRHGDGISARTGYLSEVSYNREHGQEDGSRVPTIRSIIPVFTDEGDPFGLIVVNIDYVKLISSAIRRIMPAHDVLIVNVDGDVISYTEETGALDFMFAENADQTIKDYLNLVHGTSGQHIHDAGNLMLYSSPLFPDAEAQSFNIDVILSVPKLALFSDVRKAQYDSLAFALVLIGFSVGFAALFANNLTRPLRDMTREVMFYSNSQRNIELKLPVETSDETGALSRAFTHLVSQLEDTRARSNNIINYAVDGLILIDEDGCIETFNPACEKLFGYSCHEVTGKNIRILMPDDDLKNHEEYLAGYRKVGDSMVVDVGREVCAHHRSGRRFCVNLSLSELTQGGKRYYCGIVRDLTHTIETREALASQSAELTRQKENLEFALQGGDLGFWEWDLVTGEVDFCERSAGLVGLRREEMARDHSSWNDMVDPEYREATSIALQDFIRGKSEKFQSEFRMRHVDGHWVWVQSKAIIAKRDEAGRALHLVGIQTDISERKRTELEILEQNRQLELAENVADMGHWSLDGETQTVFWSDGIYKIHGVTPDTHTPDLNSGIEFYHPDDREIVSARIAEAIEYGKPFEFSLRLVRPNGDIRHVHSKGDVIRNKDPNKPSDVFGIFQDVTDQVEQERRLAESEEKNRTVLNNIVDGVITIDINGLIDSCNPACARIFGYSSEEMKGMPVTRIVTEESRRTSLNGFPRDIKVAPEHNKLVGQTIELEGIRKSGDIFVIELAISRLQLGGENYFTGVLRDITARKQIEAMKNEFVSTVNHELRTPLTSIYGSLDLLKRMSANQLDAKCQRLVTLAHDGCGRLTNLVNDILDLEKIAAGKMEYSIEQTEITALVEDVVRRHEPLAERFNIQFVVDQDCEGVQVALDPNRFNQALVNLLSNAAKFSPPEGIVEIRTRQASSGRVRVSVSDQGPGVPENFRSRIFEKFAQADGSSKRKVAGTGLGLNITRSIIESFEGAVSFDSVEGEGTTFHFDLPIAQKARLAG